VREGACIGAATILQPWTLRLILNAAALFVYVCVFITAGPSTKMFTWGGGGIWEDMCYERRRETTRPCYYAVPNTRHFVFEKHYKKKQRPPLFRD
jgi:hypothetical protein